MTTEKDRVSYSWLVHSAWLMHLTKTRQNWPRNHTTLPYRPIRTNRLNLSTLSIIISYCWCAKHRLGNILTEASWNSHSTHSTLHLVTLCFWAPCINILPHSLTHSTQYRVHSTVTVLHGSSSALQWFQSTESQVTAVTGVSNPCFPKPTNPTSNTNQFSGACKMKRSVS